MIFSVQLPQEVQESDMPTRECEDEVARTEALQQLIVSTITALGEEKAKPFEIDARFEEVYMVDSDNQLCPRVKLVKR